MRAVSRFKDHLAGPAEASPCTRECYQRSLDAFERWWEAALVRGEVATRLSPGAVQAWDLRQYKKFLMEVPYESKPGKPGGLRKPASINTMLAAVKSFFTWAEDAGEVRAAPDPPKKVKAVRRAYKALPHNERKRLERQFDKGTPRDRAMLLLFLDCGLRASELCALRWRDITMSERKGDLVVWQGKGGKHRMVAIPKRCRAVLRELKGKGPPGKDPDEWVFLSPRGDAAKRPKRISRKTAYRIIVDQGAAAGIKVSPHMLRHTCAKDMLDRGNQVTAVQATLGHENVATTLGYLTSSPEDLRRAVERGEDD